MQGIKRKCFIGFWAALLIFTGSIINAQEDSIFSLGDPVLVIANHLDVHVRPSATSAVADEILGGTTSRVITTQDDAKGYTWVYMTEDAYGWVQAEQDGKPTLALFSDAVLDQFIADQTVTITDHPENIDAYLVRATAYISKREYESAIADYTQAIELAPEDTRLYDYRGKGYLKQELYDEAVIDLSKAIDDGRDLAGTYNRLAIAFNGWSNWSGVITYTSQAIDLAPNYGVLYSNQGRLHTIFGENDEALDAYAQAIEIDPYLAIAYGNRGLLYQDLQNYDAALADYNMALEIDPFCSQCYVQRGSFYDEIYRDRETARADFTQAIELDPNNDRAYAARGVTEMFTGEADAAVEDLKQAVKLRPNNQHAHYSLAGLYGLLGRYQDSINSYTNASEVGDDYDVSLLLYRSQAYAALEDYDSAITDLNEHLTRLNTENPRNIYFQTTSHLIRGYVSLYLGDYEQAEADYADAFELNHDFAFNYYTWGAGYRVTPRRELMIADLQAEIDNKPDDPDLYLQLGNLYMEFGRWQEAIEAYTNYQDMTDSPNSDLQSLIATLKDLIR